jgi:hypothetical protein
MKEKVVIMLPIIALAELIKKKGALSGGNNTPKRLMAQNID